MSGNSSVGRGSDGAAPERPTCPSCARPVASKGRGECLYCGASLGTSSSPPIPDRSPSSGDSPSGVAVPSRKPPSPVLEAAASARPEAKPPSVGDLFSSGAGRFVLIAGLVAGAVLAIAAILDVWVIRPDAPVASPGSASSASPATGGSSAGPTERYRELEEQARKMAIRIDATRALGEIAASIERSAQSEGRYPYVLATGLAGLEAGRSFDVELAWFEGRKVKYRWANSPDGKSQSFTLEATIAALGETVTRSGQRALDRPAEPPPPASTTGTS